MFSLEQKVAMVTGGASGIGQSLALGLAEAGADVIITSRDAKRLESTYQKIVGTGRKCLAVSMDQSNVADIRGAVAQGIKTFGKIDILVNNAGIAFNSYADEITEEEWDQTFDVNVKGVFFCCQAVGRDMISRGVGKIINISSTFSTVAFKRRTHYASSKAAINQLTKNLALEWAKHGINVNAVAPCATRTPGREVMFSDPAVLQSMINMIPLGRIAEPKDLVGATVFLASHAADMVTGQTILVDGGWTIS